MGKQAAIYLEIDGAQHSGPPREVCRRRERRIRAV